MFRRARRRLALRYLVVLALVLGAFSLVFLGAIAVVLRPAFEVAEDSTTDEAVHRAYQRSLERIALALIVADGAVVILVGGAAYFLADRTLRPIQEAHERQRRFVADASHEMRTPLAAIRSTAESALGQSPEGPVPVAALQTILGASEQLSGLTDDLLLLARSERGTLERRPERLDLSVVTAEVVESVRGSRANPAEIALTMATDLAVEADEDEIRRIVANLIDNAQRYGTASDPVRVRTLLVDGQAVVEVSDSGPGIAPADLDRIFDPFFRVRADADAPTGSGLGLAIAADLARRNGARLSVDSRPGEGATFRLAIARSG